MAPLDMAPSPRWSREWINKVSRAAQREGRAICGARTHLGDPCLREPTADNGRCDFHGGHDRIGAAEGNTHAMLHGLYARRLQPCGKQCAAWNHCPYASEEIADLPPGQRPTCPYEQAEYDALVKDQIGTTVTPPPEPVAPPRKGLMASVDTPPPTPPAPPAPTHDHHDLALLKVMLSRASMAVAYNGLTHTATYANAEVATVSAELNAFLRLSGEYRRLRTLIANEQRETRRLNDAQRKFEAENAPSYAELMKPIIEEAEQAVGMNMCDYMSISQELDGILRARREEGLTDFEYVGRLSGLPAHLRDQIANPFPQTNPNFWPDGFDEENMPKACQDAVKRAEELCEREIARREHIHTPQGEDETDRERLTRPHRATDLEYLYRLRQARPQIHDHLPEEFPPGDLSDWQYQYHGKPQTKAVKTIIDTAEKELLPSLEGDWLVPP